MEAALPLGYGYLLVLFRSAALVMVLPALSMQTVPARVRLSIAAVFALAAFLGAGAPPVEVPANLVLLVFATARETLLGALAGVGARWVLEAATSAGQVAGNAMGLGYGAQISPLTGADTPALGQFLALFALGAAVVLGVHREAAIWLCRSVVSTPPGGPVDLRTLGAQALAHGINGVGLGARVAFPVVVAVTGAHLALGLAGRFAPQLNLQSIGFTVALLAGGAAFSLFGPGAAELIARAAVAAIVH